MADLDLQLSHIVSCIQSSSPLDRARFNQAVEGAEGLLKVLRPVNASILRAESISSGPSTPLKTRRS